MSTVIYEDTPRYDTFFKVIMILPVFFIVGGAYYLATAEDEASLSMFATAILMGAIYWAVFPRKYQILENGIRIVLGGPFNFNIPLDNVETAREPKGISFGINFATCFSSKNAVEIIKRRGMRVNITPSNRDLFLGNLDDALDDWKRQKGRV